MWFRPKWLAGRTRPVRGDGVVLLTDNLEVGGVARVVLDLAEALTQQGRAVAVVADSEGELWPLVATACEQHRLRPLPGPAGFLAQLIRLRRLVRSGAHDLIHAHQRGPALCARIATAGTGVRVLEHVHNVFPPQPVRKQLSFRGDLLVGCGSAVSTMLIEQYGRDAGRVRTVHNGVRDQFPSGPPSRTDRTDAPFLLIGVGRLAEQKDPQRFVRVTAALARRMTPGSPKVIWHGDGPLREEVQRLSVQLGVQHLITFAGISSDLTAAYAAADLLLLTSRFEGLPLVALEALSAGCPVFLPDVGSCADVFGSDPVGRLYPAQLDDEQLAALLLSDLNRPNLLLWSGNARRRYESAFTLDRMVSACLEAHAEAKATNRSSRAGRR